MSSWAGLLHSSHSFNMFRRVSDGKFRRTNFRLVVQNISSQTSWQVNCKSSSLQSKEKSNICICCKYLTVSSQIYFDFSFTLFIFISPPLHWPRHVGEAVAGLVTVVAPLVSGSLPNMSVLWFLVQSRLKGLLSSPCCTCDSLLASRIM